MVTAGQGPRAKRPSLKLTQWFNGDAIQRDLAKHGSALFLRFPIRIFLAPCVRIESPTEKWRTRRPESLPNGDQHHDVYAGIVSGRCRIAADGLQAEDIVCGPDGDVAQHDPFGVDFR